VRLVALLVLLVIAPATHAHSLGVSATLRGKQVEVEAYYSDDTPARDARVMVHDHAGRFVAEGRTDEQGKWQFAAPQPGPYTVVVDAGAGHRKSTSITVPAVLPGDPQAGTPPTGPISDGPSRAEFTQFPWGRMALGLAIIAAVAIGWRSSRRGVRRMPGPQNDGGANP